MARAKRSDDLQCAMLSLWQPPPNAGDPIGVLATTFTLDTALFEEECLARFVGIQSDPMRDGAIYLIEREGKLASLKCAAVITDIHHCAGVRSLRWDILAARPTRGVMHAKLSLLAWRRHVRVIVTSANLTNDGYRRNQECGAVIDFNDTYSDRSLIDPLLEYLSEILAITSSPAKKRAQEFLLWVDEFIQKDAINSVRGLQCRFILLGPNRTNFFEQLETILPEESPEQAHIVSPFFDPKMRENGPENRLWALMKKRGTAEVHFHVAGEESADPKGWRLRIPQHVLRATPKGRSGVNALLHPILVDKVATDAGPERRPLHAKTFMFIHEKWMALIVGSSNFTSAGMGVNADCCNYEANLVYVLRAPVTNPLRNSLMVRAIRGEQAVGGSSTIIFDPVFDVDSTEDSKRPPLPAFFREATLDAVDESYCLLTLTFMPQSPLYEWKIFFEQSKIMTSSDWRSQSEPTEFQLQISREKTLPSVLDVTWGDDSHVADWTVNVNNANAIPNPVEFKGISLERLLQILSSSRPIYDVLRSLIRRSSDDDEFDGDLNTAAIDPHSKVDTTGFLLKRVCRACWAIQSLRSQLEKPLMSLSALNWRIYGPLGAYAILEAMQRQCDPGLPDEWAFLLCELWRELVFVRLKSDDDRALESGCAQMIKNLVTDVHERLEKILPQCTDALKMYVSDAIKESKHETP